MSFYKSMSALTRDFLVIPLHFSKIWLSSAVGDNMVVIKSINEKVWNVNFSKNNGTFAFTEGWSKVVCDLCLSDGCILLFKQVNPYNYILTPFFKETPYPLCDPGISLFLSISSLPNRNYIESFCHVFNDQSVNTLLLPTFVVKNTIGVGKLRRPMKVHLNSWDSLDVFVEKDSDSKCYFFTNGWNNIVQHLGVRTQNLVVLRYIFDYNFQLTLFDVNGSEVVIPRVALKFNSDTGFPSSTPVVKNVDDFHHDDDIKSEVDPEVDVLFEPSDSDESVVGSSDSDLSDDEDFDDDDFEDSTSESDDDKKDPDYQPLEFEWEYHPRHFRLNSKVASLARVDVSGKMTVQNLAGVDTVVTFRPEKHGRGFRYVANAWRTKFTKPNGINAPHRCTFVYSPDADKLILKKVSK
ncbi:putative transcription factor B3-Domain family [Helianthus annuus]|nr:putative transcription factor B3-Domain family [Helianthus annuus]